MKPAAPRSPRGASLAALACASGTYFLLLFDLSALNVALPEIQKETSAGLVTLQWILNAYTLVISVGLVTAGRLADVFGRRLFLFAGSGLWALGVLVIVLAPSVDIIIAGRVVQALGTSAMAPASLALLTTNVGRAGRPRAMAIWGAAYGGGMALGPLIGGLLTAGPGWRWIFWLNLPAIVAIALLAFRYLGESRDPNAERRIDWLGVALLSVFLGGIAAFVMEGPELGWLSATNLGFLAASLAALGGFVLVERRARSPLVDPSLMRNRAMVAADAASFLLYFAMMGTLFLGSIYLQDILRFSPVTTGLVFLPLTVLVSLMSMGTGWLVARAGARVPSVVGIMIIFAGLVVGGVGLLFHSRVALGASAPELLLPFALIGAGIGLSMAPASLAALNALETSRSGVAAGILSTSRQAGSILGVAVFGSLAETLARARASDVALSAAERLEVGALLTGSEAARERLADLGPEVAAKVSAEVADIFTRAYGETQLVTAALIFAGAVVTIALFASASRQERRDALRR